MGTETAFPLGTKPFNCFLFKFYVRSFSFYFFLVESSKLAVLRTLNCCN